MSADSQKTIFPKIGKKKLILIFSAAALGILLLTLGSGSLLSDRKTASHETVTPSAEELTEAYRKETEERVRSLCEAVAGVGNVRVSVTLSSGYVSEYAVDLSGDSEKYVLVGSGSSASPLFLTTHPPEIAGVGIVCLGGGNESVRKELISLVSAAFRVPTNRIYVTEAKN